MMIAFADRLRVSILTAFLWRQVLSLALQVHFLPIPERFCRFSFAGCVDLVVAMRLAIF